MRFLVFFVNCRYLFVVITTDESVVPSEVPDSDLVAYKLPSIMYVAAVVHNMSGDQWEKMLVLGNGSVSKNNGDTYHNVPLNRDYIYYTFVRAYAYTHTSSVSNVDFIFK